MSKSVVKIGELAKYHKEHSVQETQATLEKYHADVQSALILLSDKYAENNACFVSLGVRIEVKMYASGQRIFDTTVGIPEKEFQRLTEKIKELQ